MGAGERPSPPGSSNRPAAVVPGAVRERVFSTRMSKPGRTEALRLRVRGLLSRWLATLRGLIGISRRSSERPAALRFTKPPVQSELSLDAVKVLRNDLNDADLEVVVAKQAEAPAVPAVGPEAAEGAALGASAPEREAAGVVATGEPQSHGAR